MHHMYPVSKGDQLCPLGFHPQVRWPTRCKRCFRDYKEHGGKRGDDVAASSPSLSETTNARILENNLEKTVGRNWTSTSNLSSFNNPTGSSNNNNNNSNNVTATLTRRPSSWTSTPDLDEEQQTNLDLVVNVALPKRRHTTMLDISAVEESITIKRPPLPPSSKDLTPTDDLIILRTDSLAERARKMQLKKQSSLERESSREKSVPKSVEKEKSPLPEPRKKQLEKKEKDDIFLKSKELQILMQMKDAQTKKKQLLSPSSSGTTTSSSSSLSSPSTPTNLDTSDHKHLIQQIDQIRRELEATKARAERAEREKSDILLRRLASMDTSSNRTAATEALKLQQKVNDLSQQLEDVTSEKKSLSLKVKEFEQDFNMRAKKAKDEDLVKKLKAAEQLCEELMDENEDVKKELRNMESEIDEMHDNFRDEQANEYTTVKKELEQATKNCRILSFKFKKSERKIEQLELEKQAQSSQLNSDLTNKVKKLEDELRIANEISRKLKVDAETNQKSTGKSIGGKSPSLGTIGKSTSADSGSGKISRASLTRGGSQEDPVQLLRDLQDSMERETDIREQLKFAEEEAENLRKKATRVEDENESLMMQLKKMATKVRSHKGAPGSVLSRSSLDATMEKDEGISDEEDPTELRVLLELNEQESAQLRRKVDELERNNESCKKQITELHEKLKTSNSKTGLSASSSTTTNLLRGKLPTFMSKTLAGEINESKFGITNKNNALETTELKRQLENVEQEATVLRCKIQTLELDNEKIQLENKKLALHAAKLSRKDSSVSTVDIQKNTDYLKLKESLTKLQEEKTKLDDKLKNILEISANDLPARAPKKFTDLNTKLQLQKMINELETEISEMRAVVHRTGGHKLQQLEKDKSSLQTELQTVKDQVSLVNLELKTLKANKDSLKSQGMKMSELEQNFRKANDRSEKLQQQITDLESKLNKRDTTIKQTESAKTLLENQMKFDQEKFLKLQTDYDKEKKQSTQWENKVADLETDIQINKKRYEKTKLDLEKEMNQLKLKQKTTENVTNPRIQELNKVNDELQKELDRDKKRYSDLTGKYEQLEEEHVLIKAQLTTDKENLQTSLSKTKGDLSELNSDISRIRKEKQDLTKKLATADLKVKEFEMNSSRITKTEHEKNRLKATLEEREQEYEKLRDENEMNKDVNDQLKREIDELKRKLTDFERVNKAQNSLNDHTSNLEQEMIKLKQKFDSNEVAAKSDIAATRLRYEQQIKNLHTELSSIQRQCEKFKRDRDSHKQMLEAAQKTIGDLKSNTSGRQSRASMNSGDEDDKSKIIILEQQIGSLEDELCEARLEVSKMKTELVSEKSMSEIRMSEMQSRMNEFEEERLISSGRTKIVGMKTKLELSWQKEREEQQRLLQETSTLARDLRQTLFEVERERDKERLESRRKLDLLKKANEEELDEGRKKISELQCDLLELRDVHAKLRTSNEKLRRERERYERERENIARRRMDQDGDRKISLLLQSIDELVKIAPDLSPKSPPPSAAAASNNGGTSSTNSNNHLQANPTRRTTKSRSPSPSSNSIQISTVVARITEASEELRKYQRNCEDERERDKSRRSGMRRAASTETDTPDMPRHSSSGGRLSRNSSQNGSLYRKSLSLDQSMQQPDQNIWKQHDEDSMSSMQSIDSEFGGGMVRDSSMDSRLSGGSTQSDMPRGPRKKKRGIMGKLRSLTKGKGAESEGSMQGSDSDVSISSDFKSSKSNLKGRLSGMFRRAGSSSRDSVERDHHHSHQRTLSTERPISVTMAPLPNGSSSSVSTSQLPPPPTTPRMRRSGSRPPTPSGSSGGDPPTGTTPSMSRRIVVKERK